VFNVIKTPRHPELFPDFTSNTTYHHGVWAQSQRDQQDDIGCRRLPCTRWLDLVLLEREPLHPYVLLKSTNSYVEANISPADAVFSTIAGILFGPLCANLINPYEWFNHDTHTLLNFTLHLSRIIIGIQVFFNGANLPKKYIKTEWLSLVMVLFPIMTFGWLLIGLLIWGIIPDLSYLEALIIAACIVPTDPVLANSICKGEQSGAGISREADE
jgi:hypothetical protein